LDIIELVFTVVKLTGVITGWDPIVPTGTVGVTVLFDVLAPDVGIDVTDVGDDAVGDVDGTNVVYICGYDAVAVLVDAVKFNLAVVQFCTAGIK